MDSREEAFPLLKVILGHWKTVLGSAAAAGAVAASVNVAVLQPRYGATAILLIAPDRLDLSFDPKFRNLPEEHLDVITRRRTLEVLATSSSVVASVLDRVRPRLRPDEQDPNAFRVWVDIVTTGEVVKVYALTRDRELSAEVANTWADVLKEAANATIGVRDLEPKVTEDHARRALRAYNEAQAALVQWAEKDRVSMLAGTLRLKLSDLEETQQAAFRLRKCLRDVEHLTAELKGGKPEANALQLAHRLEILQIQLNALESPLNAVESTRQPFSLQIQMGGEAMSAAGAPVLVQDLERLATALRAKAGAIETHLTDPALQKEILDLQGEVERLSGMKRELSGSRDLAWETYLTVSRKAAESRLASEMGGAAVRLASRAMPNAVPERPKRLLNTLLAALGGAVAGFLWVCLVPARALVFGAGTT